MKRIFYVSAFALLGVLIATLIHAAIELPLLAYITDELDMGKSNWLTEHWWTLHRIGGKVLWLSGALAGYLAGKKFWRILYIEKRYGTPRW